MDAVDAVVPLTVGNEFSVESRSSHRLCVAVFLLKALRIKSLNQSGVRACCDSHE